MSKSGRPKLEDTEPAKFHVDVELLAWLDGECITRERSRSFIVNEMLRLRKTQLERRRKVRDGKNFEGSNKTRNPN